MDFQKTQVFTSLKNNRVIEGFFKIKKGQKMMCNFNVFYRLILKCKKCINDIKVNKSCYINI